MKKLFLCCISATLFAACQNSSTSSTSEAPQQAATPNAQANNDSASATVANTIPEYGYDIRYHDWEMGSAQNTVTVLDFYKHWDDHNTNEIAALFADTVRVRIPDLRKEVVIPNSRINSFLAENRSAYNETSNEIYSAVSLHDKESNEDWVFITTYNKWVEANGKRDSLIYTDNWRLKNGKIDLLMSFDKVPTKAFIKEEKAYKASKKP